MIVITRLIMAGIAIVCAVTLVFIILDFITDRIKNKPSKKIKVLHHAQKWRRGEKIGMPPPALLGLAIDKAIRLLRQKIKEEKV